MISDTEIIEGTKRIIRDLTIAIVDNGGIFTFDPITNKEYRRWKSGFNKRKDIANTINIHGGVLTGSKVLSKSFINGRRILESRKTLSSDWDFLVDKNEVFNITRYINFKQDDDKLTYRVIQGTYDSQSQDFDLIIKDDLPLSYKVGNFRYMCPLSIIQSKIDLVNSNKNGMDKHLVDIREFYWKFSYLVE